MLWHDFIPDKEAIATSAATSGVVSAINDNWAFLTEQFENFSGSGPPTYWSV